MPTKPRKPRKPKDTKPEPEAPTSGAVTTEATTSDGLTLEGSLTDVPAAPEVLETSGFVAYLVDQRGCRYTEVDEAANATPDDGEIRLTVQYIKKV